MATKTLTADQLSDGILALARIERNKVIADILSELNDWDNDQDVKPEERAGMKAAIEIVRQNFPIIN